MNKVNFEQDKIYSDDSHFICPNCNTVMKYKYAGIYCCETCGEEKLNDFGRIKQYLDTHGPTNAIELSDQTGVRRSKIGQFLRLGRLEIPKNSPVFIHCKSCGVPIRFGNCCANCAHSQNIQGAYIGEVVKHSNSKMRFIETDNDHK